MTAAKGEPVDGSPRGFDVTAVIGRVEFDALHGNMTPHVAAFTLIAEHDAPGRYEFPAENGGKTTVTVEYGSYRDPMA